MLSRALAGSIVLSDEAATRSLGEAMAAKVQPGESVLLEGPLGAGKSCLVRGFLAALGHVGSAPSPTFSLMVVYELPRRVVHADFYRLANALGTGIEDELGEATCLIEWPDRLHGMVNPSACWRVELQIEGDHRKARVMPPASLTSHT